MIESISLLNQMELLIEKAKQNPSDANMREQLTAVRALCDVVLQTQEAVHNVPSNFINVQTAPVQSVQLVQQRTMPKRAEIEQQNDSIFDF